MRSTKQMKLLSGITYDPNMAAYDYKKDPYVMEKLERAKAFFAKNGLPKNNKAKKGK